jgi:hypothetical protein
MVQLENEFWRVRKVVSEDVATEYLTVRHRRSDLSTCVLPHSAVCSCCKQCRKQLLSHFRRKGLAESNRSE